MQHKMHSKLAFVTTVLFLITGCAGGPAKAPEEPASAETEVAQAEAEPTQAEAEAEPAQAEAESPAPVTTGGKPWLNTQAKENITEGMTLSAKDDFYLYCNYDYLLSRKNEDAAATQSDSGSEDSMEEQIRQILEDDHAENHVVELVQDYYRAFIDWERRGKESHEVFRPVVEDLENIQTLDELTAFLCDEERSWQVPLFQLVGNYPREDDSNYYETTIAFSAYFDLSLADPAEYADPSEESKQIIALQKEIVRHVYDKLGMPKEEADQAVEDYQRVEAKLSENLYSLYDLISGEHIQIYADTTIDQLQEWTGEYPIKGILEAAGFGESGHIRYEEGFEDYLQSVAELYVPENLEMLKHYFQTAYLLKKAGFGDEECYLLENDMAYISVYGETQPREDDYLAAYKTLMASLGGLIDQVFFSRYDVSDTRKEMLTLFEDLKGAYVEILAGADWISEDARTKIIEKMQAMRLFAFYPDNLPDYSSLDFKGKNFAQIMREIDWYNRELAKTQVEQRVDKEAAAWQNYTALDYNAKQLREKNAFQLTYAILTEYGYHPGMSKEELYATVGYTLGHEISHGFDEMGVLFDQDGNMTGLIADQDLEAYKARVQKLIDYFDGITVFEGVNCNGAVVSAEATADITGFQAVMKLAEKEESFDYDAFFKAYAKLWKYSSSYKRDMDSLVNDPHPLDYLRVNVVLQQFDKFLETYDIHEGDGMYLAPEDRIVVW